MKARRVLDGFCRQGGSGEGWRRAGFTDVVGVDLDPQPRYPFEFVQGDAVAFIREHGHEFDLVTGSPPCQLDSDCQRIQGNDHPDLIGRPYVIENVRGALPKLRGPVMLCGAMFGMETYRHRYFETGGGFTFGAPAHPGHLAPQVKMGRPVPPGWYGQFVGNFSGVPLSKRVMDVPWMSREGIRECVPPAYTEYIGRQFLAWLDGI